MENVKWFGHASFSFIDNSTGQKIYYIDPYNLPSNLEKADIIFITHAHQDHLSVGDVSNLLKEDTMVVATPDSLVSLGIPESQKFPVEPNKEYSVRDFKFQTVPAYNTNPSRLGYHPKEKNWVGYIFNVNGTIFYHSGDTDFIPEMNDFGKYNIDVAILPMGGTYTMEVDEMIQAAEAIRAKKIIPMHYKMLLGEKSNEAEEKLKAGIKNAEVIILEEFR